MQKYKIITSGNNEIAIKEVIGVKNKASDEVILHEDILDILFKHKEEIYRKLIDLRGAFLLDHIAIKIIDPNNTILIFSLTPSVEYNLIVQNLWKHDKSFSVGFQKNNSFYPWEKAYSENYFNEIKYVKEFKHGFTFGFNISKKLGAFNLIYSYATRSKNQGLLDYYRNHISELCNIGDYGYKLIHSIYLNYCNPIFDVPSITGKQNYHKKPFFRLIINEN